MISAQVVSEQRVVLNMKMEVAGYLRELVLLAPRTAEELPEASRIREQLLEQLNLALGIE